MNIVKEMKLHDPEWSESDWRCAGMQALSEILRDRMASRMDSYLEETSRRGIDDREL